MTNKLYLFPLILLVYSIFTYLFVDPNLYLFSHPLYVEIQNFLWLFAAQNSSLIVLLYAMIIICLFGLYTLIIRQIRTGQLRQGQAIKLFIVSIIALMVSYPGLSHDIYNYMFNAKMVWHYGANPHTQVALDFPDDLMLRHMHNTHTPAPYGYGFTAISLIPSIIGQNYLKPTIILFRLLMVTGLLSLLRFQWRLLKHHAFNPDSSNPQNQLSQLAIFAFNPLILIETVGNIHNDVIMMSLCLAGIYLVIKHWPAKKWGFIVIGVLLYFASVSIKFASIAILGGFLLYFLIRQFSRIRLSLGACLSLALFAPLLTSRSQRFLPWYLIWPMSTGVFIRESIISHTLILFTFSALLGYIPFLYHGEYNQAVLSSRTLITFIPPLAYLTTQLILTRLHKARH